MTTSGRVLYKWEVYCQTESTYEIVWSEEEPTTCPNNNAHTISTSPPPRVIDEINENRVTINEEETPTQGIYKFKGAKVTIPSGTPGATTNVDTSWTYPVTIINGWFDASAAMIGDMLNVYAAPGTIIGVVTAPVILAATVINVSPTVIENVYVGYNLSLTNGVVSAPLGEVQEIDANAGTVTMEFGSASIFSLVLPTYVILDACIIENMHINNAGKQEFARKKMGGRYLPADYVLRIEYTNNDGVQKDFVHNMEILY